MLKNPEILKFELKKRKKDIITWLLLARKWTKGRQMVDERWTLRIM